MDPIYKANALRGQAIGAAFFTGFGALWIGLSLYVRQLWTTTTACLLLAGFAVLASACLWLYRQARLWPSRPEDPAISRAFNRVNSAQWIAIFIVGFSFARLHINVYVISAITAIVGVHLFPLARLFRRKLHLASGIALVLWASATVLVVPIENLQGITAFGTGTILWLSAAISLSTGIFAARRKQAATASRQSTLAA
jgi:hypothetical protein